MISLYSNYPFANMYHSLQLFSKSVQR